MSTPISQNSKLEGLELYAPQRARTRSAPDSDIPQAQPSPHMQPAAYDEAADQRHGDDADWPPADADTIEAAVARLHDAIEAEENDQLPADGDSVEAAEARLHDAILAEENDLLAADAESVESAQARLDGAIQAAMDLGRPYRGPPPPAYTAQLPPAANLRVPQADAVQWTPSAPDLSPSMPLPLWRLDPEIVPDPPLDLRRRNLASSVLRFSLLVGFAACAAYGLTLIPYSQPDARAPKGDSISVAAIAPVVQEADRQPPPPPPASARLFVRSQQAFVNEPLSLAASVSPSTGQETLVLGGLASGTRLSAGAAVGESSWRLPSHELGGLYLYAPKNFLGVMDTAIDLLSPDKELMDRQAVRLEWVAKKPDPSQLGSTGDAEKPITVLTRPMDREEAAMLMKRGQEFLKNGDITAARIAFRRLAGAGSAEGALAAATTYDPRYLAEHNVIGLRGDETQARALYERAKELGSTEATRMLARMATK